MRKLSPATLRLVLLVSCAHAMVHVYEHSLATVEKLVVADAAFDIPEDQQLVESGSLGMWLRLPFGLFALAAGFLAGRLGAGRLLLVYLFGCSLAALLAWYSPTLAVMTGAMFCLGLFASIYHPAGLTVITQHTTPENLPMALGYHGIFGSLGIALGPFLAALVLSTGATWRQLKNVNDTHDGSTSSKIRLRFSLQSDGGGGHVTWDLTVSKNGGAYAGLLGESDWQGTTSTHVSDGDPTTQQLESGNFSEGIIDDNGLIGWTNNPTPSRSEIETILVPEQTLTDTDFYDFRWTHDLNVFDTYTQTARITISAGGPAVYPPFLHRPPRHVRM